MPDGWLRKRYSILDGRRQFSAFALQQTVNSTSFPMTKQDSSYAYDFSVFTCTYNRASYLQRCYESLKDQTHKNFEWVIFDNGSTDNSQEIIQRLVQEAEFPVVPLHWPDNTGYQQTFNHGIDASKGRFWTMLDSDDAYLPEALATMMKVWESIPPEQRDSFAGVTLNCVDQHGKLVGDLFPTSPLDSHYTEMMYKYKVKGEKWGFQRTDILKQHPFPKVEDHISPGFVWRQIGSQYKTRYSNEAMRVYYIDEDGRSDQLSQHLAVSDHSARSRRLNSQMAITQDLKFFWNAPFIFLKKGLVYNWFSAYLKVSAAQTFSEVEPMAGKIITALTFIPGRILNLLAKPRS